MVFTANCHRKYVTGIRSSVYVGLLLLQQSKHDCTWFGVLNAAQNSEKVATLRVPPRRDGHSSHPRAHAPPQADIHCHSYNYRSEASIGIMKPFKVPSLVGKNTLNSRPPPQLDEDRPTKKRRTSNAESSDDEVESVTAAAKVLKKPKTVPKFQPLVSKPVNSVANIDNSSTTPGSDAKAKSGQEGYYTVLWYVSVKFTEVKQFLISLQAQGYDKEEQDVGR